MLTPLVVGAEAITVDGAYARASSKLAKSAAAFMEIKNMSSTEDRLIGARSDFAKRVELHTHIKSEDGVMKMRLHILIRTKIRQNTNIRILI
ncbi:MAG: copper chaperone PCu(A)C [Rhodobacteraceae bacterium]|nr:copper chaperone PCu(A)C [Paracoccaceae bacterium]